MVLAVSPCYGVMVFSLLMVSAHVMVLGHIMVLTHQGWGGGSHSLSEGQSQAGLKGLQDPRLLAPIYFKFQFYTRKRFWPGHWTLVKIWEQVMSSPTMLNSYTSSSELLISRVDLVIIFIGPVSAHIGTYQQISALISRYQPISAHIITYQPISADISTYQWFFLKIKILTLCFSGQPSRQFAESQSCRPQKSPKFSPVLCCF